VFHIFNGAHSTLLYYCNTDWLIIEKQQPRNDKTNQ
jgi:hypothetical protein